MTPLARVTEAARADVWGYTAQEVRTMADYFRGEPSPLLVTDAEASPHCRNGTSGNKSCSPKLTPAMRHRCARVRAAMLESAGIELPPGANASAYRNATKFVKAPPCEAIAYAFDEHFEERNAPRRVVARTLTSIGVIFLLWLGWSYVVAVVRFVVVDELWGTLRYVSADLLTRHGWWRHGEGHMGGEPTWLAGILYAVAKGLGVALDSLCSRAAFSVANVQRAIEDQSLIDPDVVLPTPVAGVRRLGAGPNSPFEVVRVRASRQGSTLQNANRARTSKITTDDIKRLAALNVHPELSSAAGIVAAATALLTRVAWYTGFEKVEGRAVRIGPQGAAADELVEAFLTIRHMRVLGGLDKAAEIWVEPSAKFTLHAAELLSLQIEVSHCGGLHRKTFDAPAFVPFAEADLVDAKTDGVASASQPGAAAPPDVAQIRDEVAAGVHEVIGGQLADIRRDNSELRAGLAELNRLMASGSRPRSRPATPGAEDLEHTPAPAAAPAATAKPAAAAATGVIAAPAVQGSTGTSGGTSASASRSGSASRPRGSSVGPRSA